MTAPTCARFGTPVGSLMRRVSCGLLVLCGFAALAARALAATDAAAERKEALDKALAEMRKELGPSFRYQAVRCFAAASDGHPLRFARVCQHTLGSCYDAYQKQFFRKEPKHVYRVYLFKNDASFRSHAKKLFGRVPDTPFGYYLHKHRALVMNIATGGGTLVHEMFHALVDEDFPDIPLWANEGIASLFEQCQVTESGLVGLVNWRLPIVQRAIRENKLPPLRKMMTMKDLEFYRSGGGNYAAARYFMLYLQKEGVLVTFYKAFRDNFKRDGTGVEFVEKVLGRKLEEVEPEWRKWVMSLKR